MPVSPKPRIKADDPLYQLLRSNQIAEFNVRKAKVGGTIDFTHCDFRSVDLRGLDPDGIDFSGSYFRQADLRGVDFSGAKLVGASINAAKISGTLFPVDLSADEIQLSLTHGTRMRYGC